MKEKKNLNDLERNVIKNNCLYMVGMNYILIFFINLRINFIM